MRLFKWDFRARLERHQSATDILGVRIDELWDELQEILGRITLLEKQQEATRKKVYREEQTQTETLNPANTHPLEYPLRTGDTIQIGGL